MKEQFNHEWATAATNLAISHCKPGCDFLHSDYAILDVILKNSNSKLGPIVILFIKLSLGGEQPCQLLLLPKLILTQAFKANLPRKPVPVSSTSTLSYKDLYFIYQYTIHLESNNIICTSLLQVQKAAYSPMVLFPYMHDLQYLTLCESKSLSF